MNPDIFSRDTILFITLFVMLIGLFLTVIPQLPGTLIIWGGALFYGWGLGWEQLGWWTFGLLTFLMILGVVVDGVAGHFGAKMGGASCLAVIVGAVLGLIMGILASLIGTPLLGCFAGLIGMVIGVLWIEWARNKDWETAKRATKGYVAGMAAGAMAKVTSGLFMFGLFLARVYLWP